MDALYLSYTWFTEPQQLYTLLDRFTLSLSKRQKRKKLADDAVLHPSKSLYNFSSLGHSHKLKEVTKLHNVSKVTSEIHKSEYGWVHSSASVIHVCCTLSVTCFMQTGSCCVNTQLLDVVKSPWFTSLLNVGVRRCGPHSLWCRGCEVKAKWREAVQCWAHTSPRAAVGTVKPGWRLVYVIVCERVLHKTPSGNHFDFFFLIDKWLQITKAISKTEGSHFMYHAYPLSVTVLILAPANPY